MGLMTSTSRITAAGLKKCRPTHLPGRFVAPPIAVTGRTEVFVARTVWGGQRASSLAKTSFLSSSFSGIASMTRSAPLAASSRFVVVLIRDTIVSPSSFEILPFDTKCFSMVCLIVAMALSSIALSMS